MDAIRGLFRRLFAESTFLRVYVLMALALLLTLVLVLAGYTLVDQVRREHYREQLADPPMTMLVQQVAIVPAEQRRQWLSEQSERLDIGLDVSSADALSLGYFERERLKKGQVLVNTDAPQGWRLHKRMPDDDGILVASLNSLNEQQLRELAEMLGEWLGTDDDTTRRDRVSELSRSSIDIDLGEQPPNDIDERQLMRLQEGDVIIRLHPERRGLSLYAYLPSETASLQWLRIGPIDAFEPMPLSLLVMLLLVMLAVLAGTIYLIIRGVEARMARLELAATRIAGGHLDTRVKVESGDFLGRLGMAFNGMASQVQSLLRAQQEMIRAVSHELRTPVARIRFAVQMVEDMTGDTSVQRQLKGIDSDIDELDGLIDEILTYARLGSDQAHGIVLDTEPLECRAMAERVVDALAGLHAHLTLSIAGDSDVEAVAEPRYLQRALQNLVANACRHARSQVVIRLYGDQRAIRLDVEDDGPGVPEGDRLEVFKPFARLDDSRTRRSGGYGLGLSIVHKIMAWHGGSVLVDDSPELGGARFSLLLPVHAQTSSA